MTQPAPSKAAAVITTVTVKPAPAATAATTTDRYAMNLHQITIPAPTLNLMLAVTAICMALIAYSGYVYFKKDVHRANFFLLLSLALGALLK